MGLFTGPNWRDMSEQEIDTDNLLREVEALHERARALHATLGEEAVLDIARLRDELGQILKECSDGLCSAGKQFEAEIERRRLT